MDKQSNSTNYIEDVLGDLLSEERASKSAGEMPPQFKKKDEKESDKKDGDKDDKDKDEKKDKDDDKEDKEASTQMFAEMQQIHPELRKAANFEATTRVLADMTQARLFAAAAPVATPTQKIASSGVPTDQARELFNQGFVGRLEKYAAADPEFKQMLESEAAAFDAGFGATMARR